VRDEMVDAQPGEETLVLYPRTAFPVRPLVLVEGVVGHHRALQP